MAKNFLSIDELLGSNASYAKHGQTAVLKLLSLDNDLLSRIRRIPLKRIPLEVPRLNICSQAS